jgi:signal transduction histidine kinase
MSRLLQGLSSLAVFAKDTDFETDVPLSEFLQGEIDLHRDAFRQREVRVETAIEPGLTIQAAPEDLKRVVGELLDNAGTYALSWARFTLKKDSGHVLLLCENDAALPDGACDQIFDRFTTLSNAAEARHGLGLSALRELVQRYNGRVKASVTNGVFTLRIAL